jgi:two-component sensor histidine kinase
VIEAELAPYLIGEQLQFTCDDMTIDPQNAVRLGLLVHELLTNAAKYGGLSTPDGKLLVRCEQGPGGALLVWREVFESTTPITIGGGFGTVLVERLAREMQGGSRVSAVTDGFEAMVIFALEDN